MLVGPCHSKVDKAEPWPSGSLEPCRGNEPGDILGQENTTRGMKEMAAGFAGLEGASMEAATVTPERCLRLGWKMKCLE